MKILSQNRKARFDYEIIERYEAGIELYGFEVKSIKTGKFKIAGAYVICHQEELWLINSDIPPYQPGNTPKDYQPKRNRRLLLHKKEIKYLCGKVREKGYALIPLRTYLKHNLIKLEIGLGKAYKKRDKRELLKKRTIEKELRIKLKG